VILETWLLIGVSIATVASFAGGTMTRRRDELAEARRALVGAIDVQHQFRERASTELARLEEAIGEIRAFQVRILKHKVVERDMITRYRASSDVHRLLFRNRSKIELLKDELSNPGESTPDHSTLRSTSERAAEWLYHWNSGEMTGAEKYAYLQWLKASPLHIAEFLRVSRLYQLLHTLKPLHGADGRYSRVAKLRLRPRPHNTQPKKLNSPRTGSLKRTAARLRGGAPIPAMLSVGIGTLTMASGIWQGANAASAEAFHTLPTLGTAISVLVPILALIFGVAIAMRAAERSTTR
jgi:hypothetical protein